MNTCLQAIGGQLTAGSLSAYIDRVNKIPMLSLEEEQELACLLRDEQNLEAARKMVMSHLRLVVRIARGYDGYGLSQADLIQEGNIGLMKAVKRFDPTVGVRLVSFAVHWIRAEIHEFVLKNWRIVKVATTKAQRKLFFNLRKFAKKRSWLSRQETQTIAEMLNVSEQEVTKMEQRLASVDESFNFTEDASTDDERVGFWSSPEAYLKTPDSNPAELLEQQSFKLSRVQGLRQALSTLDLRSQDILQKRWLKDGDKATLHELASSYQISAERVRQLEKQAMAKLKQRIGLFDQPQ